MGVYSDGDVFQSTLSMRRATGIPPLHDGLAIISIHALHEESDLGADTTAHAAAFQSTLSMRRATIDERYLELTLFISIHALHEESDVRKSAKQARHRISIHALHEESDRDDVAVASAVVISIHALHEESDSRAPAKARREEFQSTLSMRRATHDPIPSAHRISYFNPRSP